MSLYKAIEEKNLALFQNLIQKSNCDVNKTYGYWERQTLLHSAVRNKQIEMAKVLLEFGADVNAKNSYGHTPIFHVHNKEMLTLLLNMGANINLQDGNGWTVLFSAYVKENYELIEELLNWNADINLKTNDGCSIFHLKKSIPNFIHFYLVSKELWFLWE